MNGRMNYQEIADREWPIGSGPVEVSSNLVNWSPLTGIILTNGNGSFIDASVTNLNRRFYRTLAQ